MSALLFFEENKERKMCLRKCLHHTSAIIKAPDTLNNDKKPTLKRRGGDMLDQHLRYLMFWQKQEKQCTGIKKNHAAK